LGEKPVREIGRRGYNDVSPSIWRGRIAFGRWLATKTNSTRLGAIYVQRRPGSRHLRRLARGTIPTCGEEPRHDSNPCSRSALPGSIDLGPRGLAMVWDLQGGNSIPQHSRELWRIPLYGASGRLLDAGVSAECGFGGPNDISFVSFFSPSIIGDRVAYLTLSGDCWPTHSAFTISGPRPTQRLQHVIAASNLAYGMARDGTSTWWVRGPRHNPQDVNACAANACQLIRSTQIQYKAVRVRRRPQPPVS
jgi:hypothetical protein